MVEQHGQFRGGQNGSRKSRPELSAGYDSYRSLADSNLIIFVPMHTVPPLRYRAGGWELLQTSIDLNSDARARIAEEGYLIVNCKPVSSGEVIPGSNHRPIEPSLEVEFALVIARMIGSVSQSPEDMRQVIYNLARCKLQEQLLHSDAEEVEHTRRALEVAIRGVEFFSERHVHIRTPEHHPQLTAPGRGSADRVLQGTPSTGRDALPHVGPRPRPDTERNVDVLKRKSRLSHLRRAAAIVFILVAILVVTQQREHLWHLAHSMLKLEWKTAVGESSAPSQPSIPIVSASPPTKPANLRPRDYGVYAVNNDALFDLRPLPGRPPDIRIAISAVLTTASQTILPNGHPKFIVFNPDIASSIADRAEVRVIAKIAREFSAGVAGKKAAEDAWVMRNISFPLRSSPATDNPEMYELHSEDPALELPPGRYALVLKNQAYDFSVDGNVLDPRQCIERIVGSTGVIYSDCKNP